jgi:long-chain acyl-CoA synthetase
MVSPGDSRWFRSFRGYGQSETVGLITVSAFSGDTIGTHGRPSPVALVRIFDDEGRDVPAGEVGEIVVRGPTVMTGYHQKGGEPLTRTVNGWHRTNDLGRREADGSISFIGPKMRMIKSGVENIYPAEVEGCIRKLSGVKDCAIIGVPDPKWIQTVKAIVVLEQPGAQTEASVIAHCRQHLASYKKPAAVVFVESIPKQGFANDYDRLDAEFGGGNYPGGNTRSR